MPNSRASSSFEAIFRIQLLELSASTFDYVCIQCIQCMYTSIFLCGLRQKKNKAKKSSVRNETKRKYFHVRQCVSFSGKFRILLISAKRFTKLNWCNKNDRRTLNANEMKNYMYIFFFFFFCLSIFFPSLQYSRCRLFRFILLMPLNYPMRSDNLVRNIRRVRWNHSFQLRHTSFQIVVQIRLESRAILHWKYSKFSDCWRSSLLPAISLFLPMMSLYTNTSFICFISFYPYTIHFYLFQ